MIDREGRRTSGKRIRLTQAGLLTSGINPGNRLPQMFQPEGFADDEIHKG